MHQRTDVDQALKEQLGYLGIEEPKQRFSLTFARVLCPRRTQSDLVATLEDMSRSAGTRRDETHAA